MIKDFDYKKGQALQGDVIFLHISNPKFGPKHFDKEILPIDNKLILLEGEETGHHHYIDVIENNINDLLNTKNNNLPSEKGLVKLNKTIEDLLNKASKVTPATFHLYQDDDAVNNLVKEGILLRNDLAIGFLHVEGGGDLGVIVKHQEHDGIRFLEDVYYVGRQIESIGAELRKVAD